ncbi:MAG: hypothetical protein L3J67_04560 [Hyphomicrobiaceae bacterium]|nr:hypothetical protein [Hyphomicrobiaceae bacterium]
MTSKKTKPLIRTILEWGAVGALAIAAYLWFSPPPAPTLAEYVIAAKTKEGGHVRTIPSGNIDLDGFAANCKNTPLVLDNNFSDHAAAWPQSNFIIINQKYFAALPKVQKLFTFYHECGHIAGLRSELNADCYGVQQGLKLGWLDQKGLDQLCAYWRPKKGDAAHPPGKKRCERMIACFNKSAKQN